MEKFAALKKAEEEDGALPDGYWLAENPKCPHCGAVCNVQDNEWWSLYEDGEHDVSCPQCDGDFTVSTSVSYSFSTNEQSDEDDA